ncbi:shikimate kinase [soil metagenome]
MAARGDAIILIGFMGSGKSSVGRELAARTGVPLYDTDRMVTSRVGLTITDIFAQRGEEAFRDYETEALLQLPGVPAIVVTGGGVVMRAENVERLQELGVVVHLQADEETLFARVSRRANRPLLQTADPRATLTELLQKRAPLYRAAADFAVDTSTLSHEQVADAVLRGVETLHVS